MDLDLWHSLQARLPFLESPSDMMRGGGSEDEVRGETIVPYRFEEAGVVMMCILYRSSV